MRRVGTLFGLAETDLEGHAWDAVFRKRLAELGWDDETQGWFGRKQKRRRKFATPIVNVYNTPRGAVEPTKPPWLFLAVLLIIGALGVVWMGSAKTGENTPSHYNNHTGLYQQ